MEWFGVRTSQLYWLTSFASSQYVTLSFTLLHDTIIDKHPFEGGDRKENPHQDQKKTFEWVDDEVLVVCKYYGCGVHLAIPSTYYMKTITDLVRPKK